jgi:hypothetical protein
MPDLQAGDRVSYGFTAETTIDGEKTWPKMELNVAVQEGETPGDAIRRATDLVNAYYEESVAKTARMLMAANRKQR